MTRPTALRKSALEGRGVVVLLSSSSSSGGVVLRAVVVPHLAHFPESVLCSIHFLSLSLALSLRETQKTAPPRDRYERRRYEVVDRLRALSLSLSLCVSESGDKESEFKTSAFFSIPNERETLQNASKFAFLHGTNNTEDFCAQKEDKRERERDDDDATRREEASPRVHRPDAFLFFFFFIFHPRRGRIFAL
jgi:hypothetical protein